MRYRKPSRVPYAPRAISEPPSPCVTTYFNPGAGSPEKPIFAPPPTKLTDLVRSPGQSVKDATAGWIHHNGPWGWFCLLTFRDPNILEKTAHHHFMRFIRGMGMDEELYGRYYREKGLGVSFARATEHHKNGQIHYHVLISEEVKRLRRLSYMDYWYFGFPRERKFVSPSGKVLTELSVGYGNGIARIREYDSRKAGLAERYLVKYLTKERDIFLYRPSSHPDRIKSSK